MVKPKMPKNRLSQAREIVDERILIATFVYAPFSPTEQKKEVIK